MTKKNIKKFIIFVLISSIFLIGVTLRLANLNNVTQRSPDENIYTSQARIVTQEGIKGFKVLIDNYNSNNNLWIYPPPTRIAYLWLLAGIMKLTNNGNEIIGAYASTAFSILSMLFLILLGLRFFNPWVTLVALLFFGVSPMELALARRTWQDAMFGCIGLMLIYVCCEITLNTKKIIWYITFFLLGSYCILIKESGIIIYGLCTSWFLLFYIVKEKRILKGVFLFVVGILTAGIAILVLMYHTGGIIPVLTAWEHLKEAMSINPYTIEYQSGPWYYLLKGVWLLDPWNVILCIIGILAVILSNLLSQKMGFLGNSKNRSVIFGIFFVITAFMLIASKTPYCQNLRFISPLFTLFYLISGLGFWYLASLARLKLKRKYSYIMITLIMIMIVSISVTNYQRFRKIFVHGGVMELSAKMITKTSQQSRELDEAINKCLVALKTNPNSLEVYINLGAIYEKQGMFTDSRRTYEQGIHLFTKSAELHYNLGLVYKKQGLYDDAIREYQAAIELRPDYAEAYGNLGVVYAKKGLIEEATKAIKKSLEINPNNEIMKQNLIKLESIGQ